MAYKKSPASFVKHKSNAVGFMAEGSAAYMHGPGGTHPDPKEETLVSSETTRSRETTPEGITGTRVTTESKFKTPGGEVKKTAEGDRAYAALSQEQRDTQDAKFKAKQRSESQTRFIPDAIKIPTTGVRSVKQEITTPDVNKEIINKVFSPSGNPNYDLRKKIYNTKRVQRFRDYKSGDITLPEAKLQGDILKGMKEEMFSPEEIKQKSTKKRIRKVKEAITSIVPKFPKANNLAKKRRTTSSGNPCRNCN